MDDKRGDNVIDMKPKKLSILEMLSTPSPRQERSAAAPGPRQPPVPPPVPEVEAQPRDQGGLDLELPEVLDPLPKPGDPYKAHARAINKSVLTVSFLLKDGTTSRGFSYATFDSIDRLPSSHAGRRAGHRHPVRRACSHGNHDRGPQPQPALCLSQPGPRRVGARAGAGREFIEDAATLVTGVTITPLA